MDQPLDVMMPLMTYVGVSGLWAADLPALRSAPAQLIFQHSLTAPLPLTPFQPAPLRFPLRSHALVEGTSTLPAYIFIIIIIIIITVMRISQQRK